MADVEQFSQVVRLSGLSGQKGAILAGEVSGRACTVWGEGLGGTRRANVRYEFESERRAERWLRPCQERRLLAQQFLGKPLR